MSQIIIQVFLCLYGIIALITGVLGITTKYDSEVDIMTDNNHRFVSSIWAATSIGFFYCVFHLGETSLFRFLMLTLVIGGLVRTACAFLYKLTPKILFGIFLEIVPPPILWYLHYNI